MYSEGNQTSKRANWNQRLPQIFIKKQRRVQKMLKNSPTYQKGKTNSSKIYLKFIF